MAVNYGSLPFDEAVRYLRDKVNLPTATWTDIWEGQHARAFTVAGAAKEELLTDLREAVRGALEDGDTLADFRRQFDAIVQRHGWPYKGGRNWRTRVIYETNMRTAYQAGRYEQLQKVKARRPYWQYKHSEFVTHPRPEHEAWDGLVLDADDPFWDTHYPPNGWGCRCSIRALSTRDLKRLGKYGPDEAPAIRMEKKSVGVRGPNPRVVEVPEGIDPGWGYNVGKSASGRRIPPAEYEAWRNQKDRWRPIVETTYREKGRPERVPLSPPPVELARRVGSPAEAAKVLEDAFGGQPQKLYRVAGHPVTLHARDLADHIDLSRSAYLPLVDDTLEDPYEVWLNWEEHRGTGKTRLVMRALKGYRLKGGRYLTVVTEAKDGQLMGLTTFVSSSRSYMNRERQGVLLEGKDET